MSAFPYVLILPQDAHEKILVNELKSSGHDVRWNHELKSFRDDGDSVEAVIENENGTEKKTFAYICGCDGASRTGRKALDDDVSGGRHKQDIGRADSGVET